MSAATSRAALAPDAAPLPALVRWVDEALTAAAMLVALCTLVVMFLALMGEVVVRYVTSQGLGWPTELPSLLFPWLVMSGIVLAAQRGQHIAVTAILHGIGTAARRALLMLLQALAAGTFFYLAWVGMAVIEITGTEVYPVTGVHAHWAYLSLIAGFVALGVTALSTLARLALAADPLQVRAPLPHAEEASP